MAGTEIKKISDLQALTTLNNATIEYVADVTDTQGVLNTFKINNNIVRTDVANYVASTVIPNTSIDSLTDVNISTTAPTSNQALLWDSINGFFEPQTILLPSNNLSDITDPTTAKNNLGVIPLTLGGLGRDVSTDSGLTYINNGTSSAIKLNLAGIAAPTATSDSSLGYSIGSIWIFNNSIYQCTNATVGAAVWINLSNSGNGDMLTTTYDSNTDGIIDVTAGGTGLNNSTASGIVEYTTGTPSITSVGTSANNLIKLNASSQLPAVDGSLLTSLTSTQVGLGNVQNVDTTNATNISSGTLADARLSTTVTLQGNTFNGISQLVQTNASGYLPALNGSLLTNLNALIPSNNLSDVANTQTALSNLINSVNNITTTGDISSGGLTYTKGLVVSLNEETLAADKTLTEADPSVQVLDGGAVNRTITLPATPIHGRTYKFKNKGTTNDLIIQNSSAVTIVTITLGNKAEISYSTTSSSWLIL